MKGFRIKTFSVIMAFLLIITTVLIGCSKQEEVSNSDTNKEGEGEEVVLQMWVAANILDGEESPGMQVVKEFNEKYKGKIRVEAKYAPWEQHNTTIQAAFASGDAPDLFQLPQGATVRKYVETDLIQPISGLVSDDWTKNFYEGSFQEGVNQFDGKVYSWSIDGPGLGHLMYYNKEVLEKAGLDPNKPPKTWDELREMAKKVTEQGKGDVYGLTFPGGGPATFTQLPIAGLTIGTSRGSTFEGFNYVTGQYDMDSKAWVDGVNFMLSLKKDGSILPSSFTLKVQEAQVLFGEGKAAFLLDGRWALSNIKLNTPNAKFGVAHSPTQDGSTPLYSSLPPANPEIGMVVSKNTKHPEAVGKFIEEAIASKSFYSKYLKAGIGLTPMPEVNNDSTNLPYPEFEQYLQVVNDTSVNRPDPYVRNPEQAIVSSEIGGMGQSKIKPGFGEVLRILLNETEKDVAGKLKETAEKYNKGLDEGIEKAKAKGANVTLDDYKFPDWDPNVDFKTEDYEALKK
jgi:multiple sugar transport system substrate-binding protein